MFDNDLCCGTTSLGEWRKLSRHVGKRAGGVGTCDLAMGPVREWCVPIKTEPKWAHGERFATIRVGPSKPTRVGPSKLGVCVPIELEGMSPDHL